MWLKAELELCRSCYTTQPYAWFVWIWVCMTNGNIQLCFAKAAIQFTNLLSKPGLILCFYVHASSMLRSTRFWNEARWTLHDCHWMSVWPQKSKGVWYIGLNPHSWNTSVIQGKSHCWGTYNPRHKVKIHISPYYYPGTQQSTFPYEWPVGGSCSRLQWSSLHNPGGGSGTAAAPSYWKQPPYSMEVDSKVSPTNNQM